jgi:diguanylate cyclase (GGDEF)-like protein
MRSRGTEKRRHALTSWRAGVWAAAVGALLVVSIFALVGLSPLARGRDDIERVRRVDHALTALTSVRIALADFQVWIEPVILQRQATVESASEGTTLFNALTRRNSRAVKELDMLDSSTMAQDLRAAYSGFDEAAIALQAQSATVGASDEPLEPILDNQRAVFDTYWNELSEISAGLERIRNRDTRDVVGGLDVGYNAVVVTCALAAFVILALAVVGGQRARRRQRDEASGDRLADYEGRLQDGLEMSRSEAEVYNVCGLALHESVPGLGVQMLIADSSRAHFSEMLGAGAAGASGGGCGVMSPVDCPSATRGHTLVFSDSRAINACPHLRDRPTGDCSAVCVPVNIAGTTVGVTHAWGEVGVPPERSEIRYLEIASRRTSERLAMLRAFAKSESQAHSDPLTGMLNRRSLENQVRELQREGVAFAVAYGDLDQFKQLNDTHGHGTGDRALRLFSRVLRDSIRPNDMAARYGGEEFIVVLPDADMLTAQQVLERIREHLALALTSGQVPGFTVSFGLASSLDADTFDDVVAIADSALLAAKAAGRNRVITAHEKEAVPT